MPEKAVWTTAASRRMVFRQADPHSRILAARSAAPLFCAISYLAAEIPLTFDRISIRIVGKFLKDKELFR
jgi:hypothetical protein